MKDIIHLLQLDVGHPKQRLHKVAGAVVESVLLLRRLLVLSGVDRHLRAFPFQTLTGSWVEKVGLNVSATRRRRECQLGPVNNRERHTVILHHTTDAPFQLANAR